MKKLGKHEGSDVLFISIQNSSGVCLDVCSVGASLCGLSVPASRNQGDTDSIQTVCGFDKLKDCVRNPPYFGVTVGPVSNRIGGARFQLSGQQFQLEANEGKNCLHSGSQGFPRKNFSARCIESEMAAGVIFSYERPDGEGGFPGTMQFHSAYWLTEQNDLIFHYEAECDKASPINATNHAYWNLNGAGSGNILQHELKLHADRYLPVNGELLPDQGAHTVPAEMDFQETKTIGKDIAAVAGGYDHCYILKNNDESWSHGLDPESVLPPELTQLLQSSTEKNPMTGRSVQKSAELSADSSNIRMEIYTDQSAVQLYSSNMIPSGGIKARDNALIESHGAVCLETQDWVDALNHTEYPSIVLEPGQRYRRTTVHRFSW